MGVGTLRRRHGAAGQEVTTTPRPAVAASASAGMTEEHAQLVRDVAKLNDKLAKAGSHVALWKRRALELGYVEADGENTPENGAQTPPEVPPAPVEAEQPPAEADPIAKARAEAMPPKSAKTAEWVEYAERFPLDTPLDLTARPGLRDEIVAAYMPE